LGFELSRVANGSEKCTGISKEYEQIMPSGCGHFQSALNVLPVFDIAEIGLYLYLHLISCSVGSRRSGN